MSSQNSPVASSFFVLFIFRSAFALFPFSSAPIAFLSLSLDLLVTSCIIPSCLPFPSVCFWFGFWFQSCLSIPVYLLTLVSLSTRCEGTSPRASGE